MQNVVNSVAFLRTSRDFPEDPKELTVHLGKAYIDIANVVNNRTISIFPTNRPAIDGENWFLTNQRQQGFRQVYQFTTSADIPLGFKLNSVYRPTRCWGQYKDTTNNSYGIIWATSVAIAGQITFFLFEDTSIGSKTDFIRFVVGAGAPVIQSGFVVIEWISQI